MKKYLIFDTDVGTDDALALLLAASMKLCPDYLIASPGNTRADQAVRNANILKKTCGMEKTVIVAGLDQAKAESAEKNTFHGNDGLADIASDMAAASGLDEKALTAHISFEEMCETLKKADEITCIVTGPVTDLAALSENEAVREKIKDVYLMGGGERSLHRERNEACGRRIRRGEGKRGGVSHPRGRRSKRRSAFRQSERGLRFGKTINNGIKGEKS